MPRVPVPLDELLKIANEFLEGGRLPEAEKLLDHIIAAVPDAPLALHQKGVVLFRTGHHKPLPKWSSARSAGAGCDQLPAQPMPDLRTPRALRRGGAHRAEALETDGDDLQTLHNIAVVHYRLLELDESVACARRALTLDAAAAGPHFQLAEALLLKGEFAQGWEEYEWRFKIPGAPIPHASDRTSPMGWRSAARGHIASHRRPGIWRFDPILPLYPEGSRTLPDVVVVADPLLHPLIRQVCPEADLIDRWEQCQHFAVYSPLSSLPRVFATRLDTIPREAAYLHAESGRTAIWRARLDDLAPSGFRRVGIAWAGRPTHNNDLNRSMGLAEFAPIAALDGVALISLQKGAGQKAIAEYYGRAPLFNLGAEVDDFVDTMSIIGLMDVVVTVDTSIAHLAAAMGKPIWILLPFAPDWRWLLEREDSPWYPTVRLFRQARPRDWAGVLPGWPRPWMLERLSGGRIKGIGNIPVFLRNIFTLVHCILS